MLQKLNMSGDKYVANVDTYDYRVFEDLNRIRDAINEGKFNEAEIILGDLLSNYDLDTVNSRQYIYAVKDSTKLGTEDNRISSIGETKKIVDESLSGYERCLTRNLIMFNNEWRLLYKIAQNYEECKEYYNALKYVSSIEVENTDYAVYCDSVRYIMAKRTKADILGEMGQIQEANENVNEALMFSVKSDYISAVAVLTYIYSWNILEKKQNKNAKDLKECEEMLEYSYALADICDNNRRKQRIENICKRHAIRIEC